VKYTGKERDQETGLDYFIARYYSGAQGRFTSPDEFPGGIVDPITGQQVGQPGPLPYADITDPQTVNKYAYVRNNPLRYVDPDGHALDTIADVGFIIYDVYQIAKGGATTTNLLALGADVVGAAVPLATGLGTAVRAGRAAERGMHAVESGAHAAEGVHAIAEGTIGELRAAGKADAHHVIQDAAAKKIPGYNTNHAPGIQLPGPSTAATPHGAATAVQRQAGGGTYSAERRIGYKALRKAGLTPQQARRQIQRADEYFRTLGVTGETATRIPGNR
jgi:RHS repeat-associated protein